MSSCGKNHAGAVLRDHGYTMEENASLVSHDGTITSKLPCATPIKNIDLATEQTNATPIVNKNGIIPKHKYSARNC